MKLLSLNVSIFDDNNDKLVRFLKETSPDIVCLQEVTRKVEDTSLDYFITKDAIDKATPALIHSFFSPNWVLRDFEIPNFHGKEIFKHDFGGFIEIGNYVRSRFKIVEGKGVFVQGDFSYVTNWKWNADHPGQEPRMVQVVDLKIDNRKLRILNYHGIWSRDKKDTDRTKSASNELLQLASEVADPTIICGDFNLFPNTESIKALKNRFRSLVDEFKIRSTRPKSNEHNSTRKRNVVDYIFINEKITVEKFDVIESDISDHLPLLIEFNILKQ